MISPIGRQIALAGIRSLPGGVSNVALAVLFMVIWVKPDLFGWDGMAGLQLLVFTEVIVVYGLVLVLPGEGQPMAWLSVATAAVLIGVVLAELAGLLVAVVVPLHIFLRIAGMRGDSRSHDWVLRELLFSLGVMTFAALFVSVWPLPALGWTAEATPRELWWDMSGAIANRRIPFGLPAWGFLYFMITGITGSAAYILRLLDPVWRALTLDEPNSAVSRSRGSGDHS